MIINSLKIDGYDKGRSAANLTLKDDQGKTYCMPLGHAVDLLRALSEERLVLSHGWIEAEFEVYKVAGYTRIRLKAND